MSENDPAWLVACLCAGWCRTCDAYRDTFDALAREFAGRAAFRWVDIEDEADALGELDVVDFPTLLVAEGAEPRFLGPVLPAPGAARQLIERALQRQLGPVATPLPPGLVAQLREA